MAFLARLVVAIIVLAALLVHALVPGLRILALVNANAYEMVAGADPLVTAYLDAGWPPALLLLGSTLCLAGALVGTLRGERWAATLIILAAIADAVSLYTASTMGVVALPLGPLAIAKLGASMVVLWLMVRGVTRPV